MRRIRLQRGTAALQSAQMPSKEEWERAYTCTHENLEYRFYSRQKEKIFSCDELRLATSEALRARNVHQISWGIAILKHLGLPIV